EVKPEIFAYGVRNPWRMSFDRATGTLWMGDPGQSRREKISTVPRAGNLGWPIVEGDLPLAGGPMPKDYVAPVLVYGRQEKPGEAVGSTPIGGVVYHGQRCPTLEGKYVFGDNG